MSQIKSATATYNFDAIPEDGYTVFRYKKTPVSYKLALPLCFFTAIPAAWIAFMSDPATMRNGVILWLALMLGTGLGITALINFLRKPGEFKIGERDIVANGTSYDRANISSYFIKDPAGRNSEVTIVRVGGHNPLSMGSNLANVGASASQAAMESRMAIRRHIQNAGYKLCIRFGTKDVAIARGLGEREADVMFDKVKEVADLQSV